MRTLEQIRTEHEAEITQINENVIDYADLGDALIFSGRYGGVLIVPAHVASSTCDCDELEAHAECQTILKGE